jgi:hypothetical protein
MVDKTTLNETLRAIDGTEEVRLATAGANWRSPLNDIFSTLSRKKILNDRTYYVRLDGSDLNDGLTNTAGGAFASAQKAYDTIVSTVDLGGHTVTIQMADGTYGDSNGLIDTSIGHWSGGGSIVWQGNLADQTAVVINATASPTSNIFYQGTVLTGYFTIKFMRWSNPGNGLIEVFSPGYVIVENLDCGAASWHFSSDSVGCIIDIRGDYTIFGSFDWHVVAPFAGTMIYIPGTVTLTGTPNCAQAFLWAEINSSIYMTGAGPTFVGSATGKRFVVRQNSTIRGGGSAATFLPGDVAGTVDSGAVYAGSFVSAIESNNGFAGIVADLPDVATVPLGERAFVTDSTVTLAAGLGNTVVGVGGNKVPVYSDGATWIIG